MTENIRKKGKMFKTAYKVPSSDFVSKQLYEELVGRVQKIESKLTLYEKQEELIFPSKVLKRLPKEVRKTIEGVMFNYKNGFPDFCFMGMRKALIDAIRIRFRKDGKEHVLYNKNGDAFKLPKWIEFAKQERYISKANARNLNNIVRVFGDTANHDFMADLQKEEVPLVFTNLRIALSRMYYEEKKQ